jgi:hypothetical protein
MARKYETRVAKDVCRRLKNVPFKGIVRVSQHKHDVGWDGILISVIDSERRDELVISVRQNRAKIFTLRRMNKHATMPEDFDSFVCEYANYIFGRTAILAYIRGWLSGVCLLPLETAYGQAEEKTGQLCDPIAT